MSEETIDSGLVDPYKRKFKTQGIQQQSEINMNNLGIMQKHALRLLFENNDSKIIVCGKKRIVTDSSNKVYSRLSKFTFDSMVARGFLSSSKGVFQNAKQQHHYSLNQEAKIILKGYFK